MLNLLNAYGRRYNTYDMALADWKDGKDFKIYGGPYCSIRDLESITKEYGGVKIFWQYPNMANPIIDRFE